MLKHALKWGLIIGVANLAWLYLSYYLGLHTSGPVLFQIVPFGWLLITIVLMVAAVRGLRRIDPGLTSLRGLGAGVMISLISAAIAVLMQVGYYQVIHPQWPEYMVQQTREHYTLPMYAAQSAVGALILGTLTAAVVMVPLRRRGAAPV